MLKTLKKVTFKKVNMFQQLSDAHGYDRGCRELITWCADPRAFNAAFEDNLIIALQEVVNASSKDGFDKQLAVTLINSCHARRKLLSKRSAGKF
ncbi:Zinc finger MIZ domain-containing protein 1 [Toxocara canis]|uniref:Zinc finger MIZ domain-containing protein 1 n=1 Tax=Toxocara canis TaxID=6265 RepID=A0A0B2V1H7_TOXCA|nr:Zinc finger MIZ domain-containing protein 1 [Toxocara canis]